MTVLKKFTLLIVDDDCDLKDVMVSLFEFQGYTVLSAGCGRSAFDICRQKQIDLVISDMQMPDWNGMFFLESFKRNNLPTPSFIFVTGHNEYTIKECLEKGAQKVFSKPFDQKELLTSVKEALGILAA